ncbi:aldehyde dehydrogenase [Amycolatopsis sp. GM8]|uniref:aldehyde dehydrogenase family protein n=1 Tax=Amycolatopsis sp. GM8 TaxID=2896530 RepID=UPI001F3DE05F|nr:aldehyde dehydrogenase family protein [Amycolatopsis sp. GM8]
MTTTPVPEAQLPATGIHRPAYGHFIGGRWADGASDERITLLNPADNSVLATVPSGTAADVEQAIDAAQRAFPSWAATSPSQRQAVLYELAQRLRKRAADFALLDTLNHGPTITETSGFFVPLAIEQFELFSGAAWMHTGSTRVSGERLGLVHREPLGVCAQIIPWNAPLLMFAAKVAPALAAGNTVVVKPSEIASLSVLAFLDEVSDVLPPGTVNVVNGYGPAVGEPLVTDPRVRKVAFTGSRATARTLIGYAAANIIPQTMELGGKSANIVCADADLDAAAEGAAMCVVANKGEFCLAGSRVFVHDEVLDEFLDKFTGVLGRIKVGDPTDRATGLGPLASRAQLKKVTGYLELGQAEGARLVCGGTVATVDGFASGNFVEPTVFADVDNTMRIAQEEIFGPVSTVQRWTDEDDLIARANASEYGLAGGVWTSDLRRAHRIAGRLDTGTVYINQYYNFMENMPIGGYKQSGFGREFSHEVLEHYTQTKAVIVNLREGPLGMFG